MFRLIYWKIFRNQGSEILFWYLINYKIILKGHLYGVYQGCAETDFKKRNAEGKTRKSKNRENPRKEKRETGTPLAYAFAFRFLGSVSAAGENFEDFGRTITRFLPN